MIYLDTSFVAPLFRDEPGSRKVADFVSKGAKRGAKRVSIAFHCLSIIVLRYSLFANSEYT